MPAAAAEMCQESFQTLMPNHAFRYIDEEALILAEQIDRMREIFASPMDHAERLTEDELNEDLTEGLAE
jgi:hypothetical protein